MTPGPADPTTPCLPVLPDRLVGASWAELCDLLGDDWLSLDDGRGRRLVHLRDALGLVEGAGQLCARERRGLHRRGFRLERSGELRVWVWLLPDDPLPDRPRNVLERLRRVDGRRVDGRSAEGRSAALRQVALDVLRDVLRPDPARVSAEVAPADDDQDAGWDETGWDDDGCPGGWCPCGG